MRFTRHVQGIVLLASILPINVLAASRTYLPMFAERPQQVRVPVLLYHYVRAIPKNDSLGASLSVTPETFTEQLEYLLRERYTPIGPQQLVRAIEGVTPLPTKPVMLTFDDGTADFAATTFPILGSYGIPATAFIVPGFVSTNGYLTWEQLTQLVQSHLITIGSHGLNHVSLRSLDEDIADRQMILSRRILQVTTGQLVPVLAYPNGSYNARIVAGAERARYQLAFTTQRGTIHDTTHRLELPRVRPGQSLRTLRTALETR